MDSFLHVDYRIETPKTEVDGWELKLPDCSYSLDWDISWWYWPQFGREIYVYMGEKYTSYYECPFGHQSLWSDLNEKSIDIPCNHDEIILEVKESPIYRRLSELYGKDVSITWGVFKGLG